MIEHPILFSGEAVRAILEGRKTQTRRPLKLRATGSHPPGCHYDFYDRKDQRVGALNTATGEFSVPCPYGSMGDQLWVRETFNSTANFKRVIHYRATEPDSIHRWKGGSQMPIWASRIQLEITRVRIERLQEITEEEAVAEGFTCLGGNLTARECFQSLWDSIKAKRGVSWEMNPWVWAIAFRQTRRLVTF